MPTVMKRLCIAIGCLLAPTAVGYGQGNPLKETLAEFGPDREAMGAAGAKLYENEGVAVGTVEEWSNPESGGSGTVELVDMFEHEGLPCRKLLHHARLGKSADPKQLTITRCKTADGTWKIL